MAADMSEAEERTLSYGWLKVRPRWLQFLNTPKWFLFFLCQYYFTQSIVINGVYPGSISTIEKRFGFPSFITGIVTSSFDIAAAILTPFVSYMGGSRKKPVFVAWGLFAMGLSFFIFMLPHFVSPPYEGVAFNNGSCVTREALCAANLSNFGGKEDCTDANGSNKFYYLLFILGMLVSGAGASPMNALGIPYMDENVKPKVSPMYVGIFAASGVFGATVGFLATSVFLSMYVELGVQTSLTPQDQGWVGNWWLGFAIFGALCVFWSAWLLGFPKEFPLTRKLRKNSKSRNESETEQPKDQRCDYTRLKDLPKATRMVFSNVPFLCITFGACMEAFFIACMGAFAPKQIQTQFYLPPGQAAMLFGLTTVPSALVGNLLGAYINKRLKLNMRDSARMCFIVAIFGLISTSLLYIKCDTKEIAGVNKPYLNSSSPVQLSSACNQACNCSGVRFGPVCGRQLTYFSPCHAGCSQTGNDNTTLSSYAGCACVLNTNGTLGEVTEGGCRADCGLMLILFLVVVSLMALLTFLNSTPALIVTLRSTPAGQRSYALGLQMVLVRVLGAIPGPIVFGALIDKTCILWDTKCGSKGSCLEYDHSGLALVMLGVLMTCKFITMTCFFLAWFFSRRLQEKEDSYKTQDSSHARGKIPVEKYTKTSI